MGFNAAACDGGNDCLEYELSRRKSDRSHFQLSVLWRRRRIRLLRDLLRRCHAFGFGRHERDVVFAQEFTQLGADLKAGNTTAAQQDYQQIQQQQVSATAAGTVHHHHHHMHH